mmetsp:Transcript_38138/g.42569  ORF Transcript_38138/g.42569 Transcript_38138/m.42569 type:complete len:315 (+) Transcript_38138:76-1020(+)
MKQQHTKLFGFLLLTIYNFADHVPAFSINYGDIRLSSNNVNGVLRYRDPFCVLCNNRHNSNHGLTTSIQPHRHYFSARRTELTMSIDNSGVNNDQSSVIATTSTSYWSNKRTGKRTGGRRRHRQQWKKNKYSVTTQDEKKRNLKEEKMTEIYEREGEKMAQHIVAWLHNECMPHQELHIEMANIAKYSYIRCRESNKVFVYYIKGQIFDDLIERFHCIRIGEFGDPYICLEGAVSRCCFDYLRETSIDGKYVAPYLVPSTMELLWGFFFGWMNYDPEKVMYNLLVTGVALFEGMCLLYYLISFIGDCIAFVIIA